MLITSITVGAAAVTAVLSLPGSQPQEHTSLPREHTSLPPERTSLPPEYTSLPPPCTLVPAATLANYMPGATSRPEGGPAPGCSWLSISGQEQSGLVVFAVLFNSPSGVTLARQTFNDDIRGTVSSPSHGVTFTVTTRQSVTGLGDQAAAQVYWAKWAVPPPTPGVALFVRSRNADLIVDFSIYQAGSAPLPTGPQLLSETIAIARAVLTVLASPHPT